MSGGGGGGGGGAEREVVDLSAYSRPGRVREGGTPPAQLGGMGERGKLPHGDLGRSSIMLENPPNLRNNCNMCSMRRTTVHSFRKYDNDSKTHYISYSSTLKTR